MDENAIILPHYESILFLVLTPIAMISVIFIMTTFICNQRARKVPGDLVLAIATSDFFNLITYLIVASYAVQSMTPSDDDCKILGFISVMATVGDFVYNCAFCAYIYLMLRNMLKLQQTNQLITHIICIFFMIATPLVLQYYDRIGMGSEGMCFLIPDQIPYNRTILLILQLIVQILTLRYIHQRLPEHETLLNVTNHFVEFFTKYVRAMTILCFIKVFSIIIDIINSQYIHNYYLQIFDGISSLSKLFEPMVLSVIRARNPFVKDDIQSMYRNMLQCCCPGIQQQVVPEEYNLIEMNSNTRSQMFISILEGIRQNTLKENKKLYNHIDSNYPHLDKSFFKDEKLDISVSPTVIYPVKVKIYAAKLFNMLQDRDKIMVDPIKSLDPLANIGVAPRNPGGGRSGEIFFFSKDHRLIIKTITKEELKAFKDRLNDYAIHIMANPQTFLSLIYGIYTFTYCKCKQVNHVILQRNISQVEPRYFQVAYDLKGSTYDREVKFAPGADLRSLTLKDINFSNLERTVKIDQTKAIINIIKKDVNFLQSQSLMDYSLLIMKIDWNFYCREQSINIVDIKNRFSQSTQIIASIEEPGIYYHIAIIDYLQVWDSKKKLELKSKQTRYGSQDFSAKPPNEYADRFRDKLIDVIFE